MLTDLSSYSLADFLLFDLTIYRGLFGLLNDNHRPIALVLTLAACGTLWLLHSRRPEGARASAILLALAFATSGWTFFFGVYQTINWTAVYPGWAFAAQAVLCALAAFLIAPAGAVQMGQTAAGAAIAAFVVLYGLFGHPLAGYVLGDEIAALEWFGLAPDPTALVALGLFGFWPSRWRFLLAVVPVLWLAASAVTLIGLGADLKAGLLIAIGLLGLAGVLWPTRRLNALQPEADDRASAPRPRLATSLAAERARTSHMGPIKADRPKTLLPTSAPARAALRTGTRPPS
ncbi:DUF6064 family protein [Jiella marina]|uniref:DUF6064 family protein n=1 Tax=Jiella sp. LLJ827 TaxID=2917712 RepID=UPI002101BC28|nr:DUF6064 family protein [Jiella sp. LLJ827]MCQ0990275.1 DUF6064 family protein [Jiella sp. LLJ827]